MTADYQMARFIRLALRWDISGMYQIRISHIVRICHLLLHQNQHQHLQSATLIFVKFWWASKSLKCNEYNIMSINSPVLLRLTPCFVLICTIRVFEECHKVITPQHFYEACNFDVCNMKNRNASCSSLEAYAAMCAEASVCVAWRNATKGQCGKRALF